MTVFMFIVADKVPPNSDSIPLLGIFYFACMIEETLGLIAVCYTLSLYYTDPKWYKMSPWVRWLVTELARKLLGINTKAPGHKTDLIHQEIAEKVPFSKNEQRESRSRIGWGKLRGEASFQQTFETTTEHWKLAAMIVDRVMFVIFLVAISITFIVVLATVSQECKN